DTRPTRLDLSGRDAVTDDQVFGVVNRDLPGDIDGSGFADPVGSLAWTRHDALLRPQVYDATAGLIPRFLANHLLDRALASVEHSGEIDAHDLFPLCVGCLQEAGSRGGRGVVDHYVQASVPRNSGADQAIDLIPLPDVNALEKRFSSRAQDEIESRPATFE